MGYMAHHADGSYYDRGFDMGEVYNPGNGEGADRGTCARKINRYLVSYCEVQLLGTLKREKDGIMERIGPIKLGDMSIPKNARSLQVGIARRDAHHQHRREVAIGFDYASTLHHLAYLTNALNAG